MPRIRRRTSLAATHPSESRLAISRRGFFPTLGVHPALGRVFTAEEDRPGGEKVVVLSHGLWFRRFGGSANIVGQQIILDGASYTVIGIMPATFRLPEDFAAASPTALFIPLDFDRTTVPNRGSHFLRAIARLKPGVTQEQAQQSVRAVAALFVQQFPGEYPSGMHFSATVVSLQQDTLGPVRPALLILLGAVGLLLLIACANVAGLLLARADARRREFAVRTALGAGRWRIVRQLLVESLMLALLGGAVGLLFAYLGTRVLVAAQPGNVPRIATVGLDLGVLCLAIVISIGTGLAFGLVPAMRIVRSDSDVQASLKEGGRGPTAGAARQRGQRLLVIGETALTLMLLFGAGLLGRNFINLRSVNPGFQTEHILTAQLTLPDAEYSKPVAVTRFYQQLVEQLARIPGVSAAGAVSKLPLASTLGDLNFHIQGRPIAIGDVSPAAYWQVVTPRYFRALGMQMLRGRGIGTGDDAQAPGAVVINQAMANRYWPGQSPIGQRFLLGGHAGPGWVTVVGVVADVRHGSLETAPKPQMYLPHEQFRMWDSGVAITQMTVVLRTVGDPARLAPAVRRVVHSLNPNLPINDFRTMQQVVSASVARPRFMMLLLSLFAGVALTLASVGLYAVMAYSVSRRTHEIGIRMALGAQAGAVARMVITQGLTVSLAGIAIGLLGGLTLHRLMESFIFGVSATDPLTLFGVSALLAIVTVFACYMPAQRATLVDPVIALRSE